MKLHIPHEAAKSIAISVLKGEGGVVGLMAESVGPKTVDKLEKLGISFCVDTEKPLGRELLKKGVIQKGE